MENICVKITKERATREEIEDIYSIFKMFDKSGDGKLTFPELKQSMKRCNNHIDIKKHFDDNKKRKGVYQRVDDIPADHVQFLKEQKVWEPLLSFVDKCSTIE